MYLLHTKLDLLQQLSALASSNKFDYIIIEASGICEPIPIAQTITYANETLYSRGLPELFHLDNIICVADAARLSNEFTCGKHLLEPCEDEDSLDSLLMQQLEFCNTVILNKAETVNENEKMKSRQSFINYVKMPESLRLALAKLI